MSTVVSTPRLFIVNNPANSPGNVQPISPVAPVGPVTTDTDVPAEMSAALTRAFRSAVWTRHRPPRTAVRRRAITLAVDDWPNQWAPANPTGDAAALDGPATRRD
jgi:hypothetical protein